VGRKFWAIRRRWRKFAARWCRI